MSYSYTRSNAFTLSHARELASKVAADMHLCARYYGRPSEDDVRRYTEELAQYLKEGFLKDYEFGYQRDNKRVVSWRYTVNEQGLLGTNDRAGKVISFVDVTGATFFNTLTENSNFERITTTEQQKFYSTLPVTRVVKAAPSDGEGYWASDKNYFSGDRELGRQTFRPYT